MEAGVQRWNDNGSADVLVAATIKSTSPNGKTSGSRWMVTTIEERQQRKICQLIQVIWPPTPPPSRRGRRRAAATATAAEGTADRPARRRRR